MKQEKGDIVWVEDYQEDLIGYYEVEDSGHLYTNIITDFKLNKEMTVHKSNCKLVVKFAERMDRGR